MDFRESEPAILAELLAAALNQVRIVWRLVGLDRAGSFCDHADGDGQNRQRQQDGQGELAAVGLGKG